MEKGDTRLVDARSSRRPTVSVVIPTFNRREPLWRAIGSVWDQSERADEFIVVDDNGSLQAQHVLSDMRRQGSPAPIVIRNEVNLGAGGSRNVGLQRATSDYVAFLDSDDYWDIEKLKLQRDLLVADPSLSLVYCDQWIHRANGAVVRSGKRLLEGQVLDALTRFWLAPNTSTLVLHRKTFLQLGGFDVTLRASEDHDVWMHIASRGLAVGCVREPLAHFVQDGSDRLSHDYSRRVDSMNRFLDKWHETIVAHGGEARFRRFRYEYHAMIAVGLFFQLSRKRDPFAWTVFRRHLLANPMFYRGALRRLAQKLTNAVVSEGRRSN